MPLDQRLADPGPQHSCRPCAPGKGRASTVPHGTSPHSTGQRSAWSTSRPGALRIPQRGRSHCPGSHTFRSVTIALLALQVPRRSRSTLTSWTTGNGCEPAAGCARCSASNRRRTSPPRAQDLSRARPTRRRSLTPRRLYEQCGRGVCFDVMIGRLVLGHRLLLAPLLTSP
jgi:hypothetical protein